MGTNRIRYSEGMHKYLVVAMLVACSGSTPSGGTVDAPPNQPYGAKCVTASDMSTECATGVCTNTFDTLGYSVCSAKCTMLMATDPTCPATPGAQFCNKKGYCKPF